MKLTVLISRYLKNGMVDPLPLQQYIEQHHPDIMTSVYIKYRDVFMHFPEYAETFGLDRYYVAAYYVAYGMDHPASPIEFCGRPVFRVGSSVYDETEAILFYGIPMYFVNFVSDRLYLMQLLSHYMYVNTQVNHNKNSLKETAKAYERNAIDYISLVNPTKYVAERFLTNVKNVSRLYFKEQESVNEEVSYVTNMVDSFIKNRSKK